MVVAERKVEMEDERWEREGWGWAVEGREVTDPEVMEREEAEKVKEGKEIEAGGWEG